MQAAAATQVRVVGALILREARTRFGRSQLGYLWALVEPVAVVVSFTLVTMALSRVPPYGDSLLMFFALGALAYNFFRRVAGSCAAAFEANQALLQYPVVKQVDTLVARAALESATCMLVALLLIGGLIVLADQPAPARIEAMLLAMLLLAQLGFGWGALSAVISKYVASWRFIEPVVTRPLFLMSGIFFVPDRMPPKLVEWLAWNPVLHGVELMRYGYYPGYRSPAMNLMYLSMWALGLTLVALSAERAMRLRGAGEGAPA